MLSRFTTELFTFTPEYRRIFWLSVLVYAALC
jgi:hypothetical protein